MKWRLLLSIPLLARSIPAQESPANVRTWYIPALSYGANNWSVIRITDSHDIPLSVNVDVFRIDGSRVNLGPVVTVEPHRTVELRVEAEGPKDADECWARIVQNLENSPASATVEAFVEVLHGNKIENVPRDETAARPDSRWVLERSEAEGNRLYYVNLSGKQTVLHFCSYDNGTRDGCLKKPSGPSMFAVDPNHALLIRVRNVRKRYLIVEASGAGEGMMVLLSPGEGATRTFTTDSSIRFGTPLP